MPRRARLPSASTVFAAVRGHFGLTQPALAAYLGLTGAEVAHLESGRRALTPAVAEALVAHLPPPTAAPAPVQPPVPPPRPADLAGPARPPLEARLDYCRHHARRLRRALRPLEAQAAFAAHWRAALPALLAALPPAPDPAAPAPDPAAPGGWPTYVAWFRRRWLATRPTALPPDASARHHLLRLQAEGLETEAAALAALLAEGPPNGT